VRVRDLTFVGVIGVLLVLGLALAWATTPPGVSGPSPAVPTFSNASANAATAPRRVTLLPTDCADVLSGKVDPAALLARPIGSVSVHTVLGQPAPGVGLLERLSCSWSGPGQKAPLLSMTLTAFADPAAAARQRERNINAETDAQSAAVVPLGDARATLLTEQTRSLLMVAYDRYTVDASLPPGVVPGQQEQSVLVDVVRRALPTLPPMTPPAPPAPAASRR
jgi:hypothetical protein